MTAPPGPPAPTGERPSAFRHELYPYEGGSAFLAGALSFIDDAVTGGETVLIAVGADKREMLRGELAGRGAEERVSFVDTDALGRNPGRLIPAWQDWIAGTVEDGLPVRGISESPWQGASSGERGELRVPRVAAELAFDRSPAWWLLCPYAPPPSTPARWSRPGAAIPFDSPTARTAPTRRSSTSPSPSPS